MNVRSAVNGHLPRLILTYQTSYVVSSYYNYYTNNYEYGKLARGHVTLGDTIFP